jgi:hypothetical protein
MGGPKDSTRRSNPASLHTTKKCPNCYTYLALSARICTSCHARVGDVDRLGFAQKPFDWKAYLLAAVTMAAFAVFIWWAFFRE